MAVKTNEYRAPLSNDTSRGPSTSIWGDCPLADLKQEMGNGPQPGYLFEEEFQDFPDFALFNGHRQLGQWDCWVGNNAGAIIGTGADTTNLPQEGGVIGLYGGTTAIDITMVAGTPSFRMITPATGYPYLGKMWYECRIAVSVLTSAYMDLFLGLMDPGFGGTQITTAASLAFSSTNTLKTASGMGGCFGFWKRATTNPSDVGVAFNVNNGTVQYPGSSSTLNRLSTNSLVGSALTIMASTNNIPAANVFIKLGFVFDPTSTLPQKAATSAVTANQTVGSVYKPVIQFFVNGYLMPWFLNTADVQAATFPNSFMCPVIAYRSGGTGTGIGYVDWVRCAQIGTY